MDLYLHIGTNKTGSSAIQSSIALNTEQLLKNGIYVPSSPWDNEMKLGNITPGNGNFLARLLVNEQKPRIIAYLGKIYHEGLESDAKKVILSNEILIRLFSNPQIVNLLNETSRKVGFQKIKMLCFIRNPHQHALSLYKHRAKSGMHSDYDKWFDTNYETSRIFREFLKFYSQYKNFNWSFRLYSKEPDHLFGVFYKEFLNTSLPDVQLPHSVNRSLNLNNIRLIQAMECSFPGINSKLYQSLLNSDAEFEENQNLVRRFQIASNTHFSKNKDVLQNIADLLPIWEREFFNKELKIPLTNKGNVDLELTPLHINLIQDAIKWHRKNRSKQIFQSYYRKLVKRVSKLVKTDKFNSSRYGGSLRQN